MPEKCDVVVTAALERAIEVPKQGQLSHSVSLRLTMAELRNSGGMRKDVFLFFISRFGCESHAKI
jgi:hypothetical protein